MGLRCFLCRIRHQDGRAEGLSFHNFPSDIFLKARWFSICGIHDGQKVSGKVICSKHFKESDFEIKPSGLRVLKINTVPDLGLASSSSSSSSECSDTALESSASPLQDSPFLLDSFKPLEKMFKPRILPGQSTTNSSTETADSPFSERNRNTRRYIEDCMTDVMNNSRKAKIDGKIGKKTVAPQKNKILALQAGKRSLNKRITYLLPLTINETSGINHLYVEPKPEKNCEPDENVEKINNCRICLTSSEQLIICNKPIKDMIVQCAPFMEHFVTNEHFICMESCFPKLKTSYSFLQACLKAKESFTNQNLSKIMEEKLLSSVEEDQIIEKDINYGINLCDILHESDISSINDDNDLQNKAGYDIVVEEKIDLKNEGLAYQNIDCEEIRIEIFNDDDLNDNLQNVSDDTVIEKNIYFKSDQLGDERITSKEICVGLLNHDKNIKFEVVNSEEIHTIDDKTEKFKEIHTESLDNKNVNFEEIHTDNESVKFEEINIEPLNSEDDRSEKFKVIDTKEKEEIHIDPLDDDENLKFKGIDTEPLDNEKNDSEEIHVELDNDKNVSLNTLNSVDDDENLKFKGLDTDPLDNENNDSKVIQVEPDNDKNVPCNKINSVEEIHIEPLDDDENLEFEELGTETLDHENVDYEEIHFEPENDETVSFEDIHIEPLDNETTEEIKTEPLDYGNVKIEEIHIESLDDDIINKTVNDIVIVNQNEYDSDQMKNDLDITKPLTDLETSKLSEASAGTLFSQEARIKGKMKKLRKVKIQCPTCKEELKTSDFLKIHAQTCSLEEDLSEMLKGCKYCSLAVHGSELQAHFNEKHAPFLCKSCNLTFKTTVLLEIHLSEVHKYLCPICNKRLGTEEKFISHLKRHDIQNEETIGEISEENNLEVPEKKRRIKTNSTVCDVCGKSVHTNNMGRHKQVHEGIVVNCNICNASMKKNSLANHMSFVHGSKSYICTLCDKSFNKKANLEVHILRHEEEKKFKCDICSARFKTQDCLYNHKIGVHYQYKCNKCTRTFLKQESYDNHIEADCKKYIKAKKKAGKKCDICFKVIVSKTSYEYHRQSHIGDAVKCNICGKEYKHKLSLAGHMKYHEKKFVCDFCGLITSSSGNLIRHKIVHNDEKAHLCGVCWEKFYTLEELNEHSKKHEDRKMHECDECGEKFNRPYLLECHINKVHTD